MPYAQKHVPEELKARKTLWSICYIFCKQAFLLSAFCSTRCKRQKFSHRVRLVSISLHLSAMYPHKNLDCEERSLTPDSPKRVKSWRDFQAPQRNPKAEPQTLGSQERVQATSSLPIWGTVISTPCPTAQALEYIVALWRWQEHPSPSEAPQGWPYHINTRFRADLILKLASWLQGWLEALACHMVSLSPGTGTS